MQIDVTDITTRLSRWTATGRTPLPRYEFAVRDVATGAAFLAFARTLSDHAVRCFAEKVIRHLETFGLKPHIMHAFEKSVWIDYQLDRELVDWLHEQKIIPSLLHGRPASYTWSVTSLQKVTEVSLYGETVFEGEWELFERAFDFERAFNLERPHPRRKGTPLEIARRTLPELPAQALEFEPFCLDECRC